MVIIKSPKIVVFLQALYSIQGLCNPLMGVFDVNHALLFYASQMASKTLSRENHGKNWAKKMPTALFSSDWHFKLLGYPDSNQERQDQNLQCYHYTIPQCLTSAAETLGLFLNADAKVRLFFETPTFLAGNLMLI